MTQLLNVRTQDVSICVPLRLKYKYLLHWLMETNTFSHPGYKNVMIMWKYQKVQYLMLPLEATKQVKAGLPRWDDLWQQWTRFSDQCSLTEEEGSPTFSYSTVPSSSSSSWCPCEKQQHMGRILGENGANKCWNTEQLQRNSWSLVPCSREPEWFTFLTHTVCFFKLQSHFSDFQASFAPHLTRGNLNNHYFKRPHCPKAPWMHHIFLPADCWSLETEHSSTAGSAEPEHTFDYPVSKLTVFSPVCVLLPEKTKRESSLASTVTKSSFILTLLFVKVSPLVLVQMLTVTTLIMSADKPTDTVMKRTQAEKRIYKC